MSRHVKCDGALPLRNHADAAAQSAGVKFGLLPERQADIPQLARAIRASVPTLAGVDAAFDREFAKAGGR